MGFLDWFRNPEPEWKTEESNFTYWQYCPNCNSWLSEGGGMSSLPSPSKFEVCPSCGHEHLERRVGKYRYRIKRFKYKYTYKSPIVELLHFIEKEGHAQP